MAFLLQKMLWLALAVQLAFATESPPQLETDYAEYPYAFPDGQPKFFFYPLLGQNKPFPFFIAPAPTTTTAKPPAAATTAAGNSAPATAPSTNTPAPPVTVTVLVTPPPPSGSCTGTVNGLNFPGTCSSSCGTGTVNAGTCGTGTVGFCCTSVFTTCGQTTSAKTSFFLNPGFPTAYASTKGACTFNVQRSSPDVCLARVEYTRVLLSSNNGCPATEDSLTISGTVNGASNPGYSICGTHNNDYAFVEFGLTDTIPITINPTQQTFDANRVWNIKVTQVPNSCSFSG